MIQKALACLFSFFTLLYPSALSASNLEPQSPLANKKVLICGVCRNVGPAVRNDIANIERLGSNLSDYAVIICEDNSKDDTVALFTEWAQKNERVIFTSEIYDDTLLCREERIARARNKALKIASDPKYEGFDYLIMVDLDFQTPWPIEEIIRTLNREDYDWDCVSSNGELCQRYNDRYAFRSERFPLGPELLGDTWHKDLSQTWFRIPSGYEEWIPVYSAFGGLAIYKTASILPFTYSGKVTDDLKEYYRKILLTLPSNNYHLRRYLRMIKAGKNPDISILPIELATDICCEHVPLHASMALHGFSRFFVNPKLILYY